MQNAAERGLTPCLRLVLAIRNMNKVSGFCFSDAYYINSYSNNASFISPHPGRVHENSQFQYQQYVIIALQPDSNYFVVPIRALIRAVNCASTSEREKTVRLKSFPM